MTISDREELLEEHKNAAKFTKLRRNKISIINIINIFLKLVLFFKFLYTDFS